MQGHGLGRCIACSPHRRTESAVQAVRLGGSRQVDTGFGQREVAFRRPEEVKRIPGGYGDLQGSGIGQADVFHRHAHQAACEVHRILAAVQHSGQPVQRTIRIRAAYGLVQRGDQVVVLLTGLVVPRKPALQCGFNVMQEYRSSVPHQVSRRLEGIQRPAGIPVGGIRQPVERFVFDLQVTLSETPLTIRQRAPRQVRHRLPPKGLQHEYPGPAEQRPDDFKAGVFGGSPYESDGSGLHVGEERILL